MPNLRRLTSLFCCLLLTGAMACGDEDSGSDNDNQNDNQQNEQQNDNQEDPVEEPPDDPQELCEAACGAIYGDEGCDDFFVYEDNGGAMPESVCVERCVDDEMFRGGEWCVATEAECTDDPADMIEACFPDDYHHPNCSHLGFWPLDWERMEFLAVELVNEHRRDGLECDGSQLGPVDEVEMHDALLCAARLHSIDMVEEEFFSSTNPETGKNTADRIADSGYNAADAGGIVTSGQLTAEQLVQGWAADSDHCSTIMGADFEHIGIGRYEYERWTLKMAGGGE